MAEGSDIREAIEAFQRGDLDHVLGLAHSNVGSRQSAQWRHLLGLVHCRLGDPVRGVEHLRAAAQAEPDNPAFAIMLARALVDAGRADEVLQMPEPPPAGRSPTALAMWQSRAEAADAAGRTQIAADAWARVAEAAPGDWRAQGNLANALKAQQRWAEAAEALVAASRLNPAESAIRDDAVATCIRAGIQHQDLLRFDEAAEVFRRAYELTPSNPAIIRHLGAALERTNRLEDLAALLDEALGQGVPEQQLGYLRAVLARRRGQLEDARDLLMQADPADDPVAWNALKSKIEDSLGNSHSAFDAATAMNRAAVGRSVTVGPEEWERQTAAYRDEQRSLARVITPEWGKRVPVLVQPVRQRIAFLVGFPRSGTTLIDTFLLGHPEIEVLEEKQLVAAAAEVAGPIAGLPGVSLATLERARGAYLDRLADEVGARFGGLTVDKFPLDMASAPLIHAMFPTAPILFAQRHPCDVVLSGFLQPFGVVNFSDIGAAADYYDAMMSVWTASLEALPLKAHTIVYEELVQDPEAVLREAVAFLGLDWDNRILDHRRTAKSRGTIVTPSYDQVTEAVSTKASGRWRRYRDQLEPVLPVLLPWAERLGYRA